jgi:Tol biopolymer transport system component/DNA-binding winged helix-turn-helix (wHTH) protein
MNGKRFYEFGCFRLSPDKPHLLRDGEPVSLTQKQYDLLLALVKRKGQPASYEELKREVWPETTYVRDETVRQTAYSLRQALGDNFKEQKYIGNAPLPVHGYHIIPPIQETNETQAAPEPATVEPQQVNDGAQPGSPATQDPAALVADAPVRRRLAKHWLWLAALTTLTLLIGAASWFYFFRPIPAPPQPKIVQFTSFANVEKEPTFSPDGNLIAFQWTGEDGANPDIYVKMIGADMPKPLRLTTDPATDTAPTWSPDGRHIAFLRQSAKGNGFYAVPALGGVERKITDAFTDRFELEGQDLNWSPDGKSLAVMDKNSLQEPWAIFLLSPETGEKRRLTSPPAQSLGDGHPVFSPDGETLAFVRFSTTGVHNLHLAPAAGGEPRRITHDNAYIRSLAWTADGREIIFSSRRDGSSSLWRVSASGGTPQRLTVTGYSYSSLAISRKGDCLAYTQSTTDINIWRMGLPTSSGQGQASTRLVSSAILDHNPQYSPDGKRIVFASNRSGAYEIWMCGSEGEDQVQLTNFGGPMTGSPQWSPDGRHIVFDSRPEGNADIFVISAEGGKPRRLTFDSAEDVVPQWSRDGRWIYFGSNRNGGLQVWKMPAEGVQATQLTKQGGFEGVESPDGRLFYYSKGRNIPGVWRIPVEGGEESLVLDSYKAGVRRAWAVMSGGIYFIDVEPPAPPLINFFNFATRKVAPIAKLEKTPFVGLALSPDNRWLLYTQVDQDGSDIMLIENFR